MDQAVPDEASLVWVDQSFNFGDQLQGKGFGKDLIVGVHQGDWAVVAYFFWVFFLIDWAHPS
jgi:hypothetical protein